MFNNNTHANILIYFAGSANNITVVGNNQFDDNESDIYLKSSIGNHDDWKVSNTLSRG